MITKMISGAYVVSAMMHMCGNSLVEAKTRWIDYTHGEVQSFRLKGIDPEKFYCYEGRTVEVRGNLIKKHIFAGCVHR